MMSCPVDGRARLSSLLVASQELYSGADDCTIVVWTSPQQQNADLDANEPEAKVDDADADAWSDSD